MIENIKRILNEHQTLIVVVISVLVICFLYWWFCCKDKRTITKGGTGGKEFYRSCGGFVFQCFGIKIIGQPFVVLNKCGRRNVGRYVRAFKTFRMYINNNLDKECDYNIITLVSRPLLIFVPDLNPATILRQFLIPGESRGVYTKGGIKILSIADINFDAAFGGEGLAASIVRRYNELVDFLESVVPNCICEIDFIGQPSICASGKADNTPNGRATHFSPNDKGNLCGDFHGKLLEHLRSWYPDKTDDKKNLFKSYAYLDAGGEIQIKRDDGKVGKIDTINGDNDLAKCGLGISPNKDNDSKDNSTWHVADIYPSHKLHEMIFFLFGLMEKYIIMGKGTREDYYELMAAYVIFANYINLGCGIQMESSWNCKIGNLYVYDYDEKNVLDSDFKITLNLDEMEVETMALIGKELRKLNLKPKHISLLWESMGEEIRYNLYKNYATKDLTNFNGDNVLLNIDYIIDIIRNVNQITDIGLISFLRQLSSDENESKTKIFRDLCRAIYNNKVDKGKRELESQRVSDDGDNDENPSSIENPIRIDRECECVNILKRITKETLDFVETESDTEEVFENVVRKINDEKIFEKIGYFKEFLTIINYISLYHYRNTNFMSKIEEILIRYKDYILKINKYELFCIFKDNLLILRLLLEEKILEVNVELHKWFVMHEMSFEFFYNYFKSFFDENELNEVLSLGVDDIDEFTRKQKIGENDDYVCELIRNDSIEEFIIYIGKNSIDINSVIEPSIYETNPLLNNNNVSLIQYAAFFGSLQIFTYLFKNKCKIDNAIWLFTVHSNNAELTDYVKNTCEIAILDEKQIIEAATQSFHIDIHNYFIHEFDKDGISDDSFNFFYLKYHNFMLVNDTGFNTNLSALCTNNHYILLEEIFKKNKINGDGFIDDSNVLMSTNGSVLLSVLDWLQDNSLEDKDIEKSEDEKLDDVFRLIEVGLEAANKEADARRRNEKREVKKFEYIKIEKFFGAYERGVKTKELYIKICERKGKEIDVEEDEFIKYLEDE